MATLKDGFMPGMAAGLASMVLGILLAFSQLSPISVILGAVDLVTLATAIYYGTRR